MNSTEDRPTADLGRELERQVRQARKFTPEEAIGRLAGAGAMKGGSAVSLQQQAENEVGCWLRNHLNDPMDALRTALNRQLKGSELLLANLDQPLIALETHCERLLGSDYLLKELVREADVEWGRAMDEPPYFERAGSPPHPDDPYTVELVRNLLGAVIKQLEIGVE